MVQMEDRAATWTFRNMSGFAIFDGHGGPEISQSLSEQLHVAVTAELASLHDNGREGSATGFNYSHAIQAAFKRVDDLLLSNWTTASEIGDADGAAECSPKHDPGSTAVMAIILPGNQLLVANVGNSKAILCSERSMNDDPANVSLGRGGEACFVFHSHPEGTATPTGPQAPSARGAATHLAHPAS